MSFRAIERIESRILLSSYTVDTLSDDAADAAGTPDGQISLREAIIAANTNAAFGDAPAGSADGDVIRFAASIANGTITLGNGELAIVADLVVDGQNRNITVSGNNASRILNINTNEKVKLQDLKLANGSTAGSGGAVYLAGAGDTLMRRVSITGSTAGGAAATDGGGAIFNTDQDLRLYLSNLTGNSATGAAGSGGALFTVNGEVKILRTTIQNNSANRAGGGVEITNSRVLFKDARLLGNDSGPSGNPGNGGAVHVTAAADTKFVRTLVQSNTASSEGGGLWNSATGTMKVLKSKVDANTASGNDADMGGGGIFNNGGDLFVSDTEIDDNVAGGTSGSGGGILTVDGYVTVVDSLITDNTSNRAGGGVEIIEGDLRLAKVAMTGNATGAAPGNGGGLHVTGAADTTIVNTLVQSNTASSEGGGLWNSATGEMVVLRSKIDANTASGAAADNGGGGIFNNGGDLLINRTEIDDNVADGASGSGGGILSVGGDVTLLSSTVSDNVANRAGGGIEIIDGELDIDDAKLIRNIAGPSGSAAPGNGGALHVTGVAEVNLYETLVQSNVAASEGGGLWNQAGSDMYVVKSKVDANRAGGADADMGGGGIFNNGGDMLISKTEIDDNIADGTSGSGGGLLSTDGTIKVFDSLITDNRASRAGGGVEIISGSLRLDTVMLTGNMTASNPGNGGGLHVTGNDASVYILESVVRNNFASREGGGLWNQSGSVMEVFATVIDRNTAAGPAADDGGGGIFNNGGQLYVEDSTIDRNKATGANGGGGGVFNGGPAGFALIEDTAVSRNTASTGGGVFTAAGATTDLEDVTFFGNSPNNTAGPGTVV